MSRSRHRRRSASCSRRLNRRRPTASPCTTPAPAHRDAPVTRPHFSRQPLAPATASRRRGPRGRVARRPAATRAARHRAPAAARAMRRLALDKGARRTVMARQRGARRKAPPTGTASTRTAIPARATAPPGCTRQRPRASRPCATAIPPTGKTAVKSVRRAERIPQECAS